MSLVNSWNIVFMMTTSINSVPSYYYYYYYYKIFLISPEVNIPGVKAKLTRSSATAEIARDEDVEPTAQVYSLT